MGCFSDREKGELEDSQKWAYVTLSDFKASGALAYFSYIWLWFLALVAVAVYGADTFTAVNLLAYDRWSSQIQPAIPLQYSKWIFAVCIFISWALCAFEWVRAIRVIRRGSIAESYMDPLAAILQSMRPRGWKRFLVFAELTKSKKGVDYIALFVYFSFQGALRVVLAEAPRQVINGITLYSVMKAEVVPIGDHATTSGHSSIEQFFLNIETLAETNREQALVLFTMMFTLVIWVISALSLIAAVLLYLTFLWHYIPREDGRLSIYCRRKIDRRLSKIVSAKVKQAVEDQEKQRSREDLKASKSKGALPRRPVAARQPTLPQISGATPRFGDDKLPDFRLARQDSEASLAYSSQPPSLRNEKTGLTAQPGLPREPTLPDLREQSARPGFPGRSTTLASNTSYSSNAPLLRNATGMGYTESQQDGTLSQPRPILDRQVSSSYGSRPIPDRQMSASTNASRPYTGRREYSSQSARPLLDRDDSASSFGSATFPDRQMSASPYDSAVSRQVPASPYGVRPDPERQVSTTSYSSRLPPIRSMTPLTEVATYMSTTPGVIDQSHHELAQYHSNVETRQMNYTPVYGSVAHQNGHNTQNHYQPFSPPTNASSGVNFANRNHASASPAAEAIEMSSRPATAPLAPSDAANTSLSGSYIPFNPLYPSKTNAGTTRRDLTTPRNNTRTPNHTIPQRSATAPPEASTYEEIIDEYGRNRDSGVPTRRATAGPGGHGHERW